MIDRLTRILYNNQFYKYPIQPLDALTKLGPVEVFRCLTSYMIENLSLGNGKESNFEDWVVSRFGRRLYEIFFKTYSEKLWGIPCNTLDADFATQRIKRFSLYEALKSALMLNNTGKHKTLVEKFAYPNEGSGKIYELMAGSVCENGGNILLNTYVKRVINSNGTVSGLELADGTARNYDHIVSTMPLTQLVLRMDGMNETAIKSAKSLRFRNTILVYLKIESENLFPDNWIYVHSTKLKLGRITNFRNWSSELYGEEKTTIVALEYWCNDSDRIWSMDDTELIDLGKKDIVQTGLAHSDAVSGGHIVKIHRCYPVYHEGYKELLKPVISNLNQIKNLTVIGRYGSFKYNNQDHSILMGILAAENIVNNAQNDLWSVNTDYEYQEAALISESGLVRLN